MNPFRLPRWRFTNCCGHEWGQPRPRRGPSRRDFLRSAATGVAGLAAVATLDRSASAQVRVFPPPPPTVSPIEGLIDFHNHNAPDVFGRAVDDDEIGPALHGPEDRGHRPQEPRGAAPPIAPGSSASTTPASRPSAGWRSTAPRAGSTSRPSSGCGGCRAATAAWCGCPRSTPTTTSSTSRTRPRASRSSGPTARRCPRCARSLKICAQQKLVALHRARVARRGARHRRGGARCGVRPHRRHPRGVRGGEHDGRADEEGGRHGRQARDRRDGAADGPAARICPSCATGGR